MIRDAAVTGPKRGCQLGSVLCWRPVGHSLGSLKKGTGLSKLCQTRRSGKAHYCNEGDGQCAEDGAQLKYQVPLK